MGAVHGVAGSPVSGLPALRCRSAGKTQPVGGLGPP